MLEPIVISIVLAVCIVSCTALSIYWFRFDSGAPIKGAASAIVGISTLTLLCFVWWVLGGRNHAIDYQGRCVSVLALEKIEPKAVWVTVYSSAGLAIVRSHETELELFLRPDQDLPPSFAVLKGKAMSVTLPEKKQQPSPEE